MTIHPGDRPGCIGRIVQMHGEFYAAAAGFGVDFEAKVATELSDFCRRRVEGRDGLWLALDGDRIEGSIAIDGLHAAEEGAHLRWFIASGAARGSGVGRALLGEALAFCDARGYGRTFLWTFDALHAARHLYEQHGFALAHTQRGAQWGREVTEQRFVRAAPGMADAGGA
ncbi:GNAT family N-acetyltransferase [uncultured Methylibium sp.]|uniref:GNAT family N-acetyltransferase n=1 Tax=uncultured Methylibium sp. TaxID=381093 RepID=UPI0025EC8D83|nr:GNAT family N-acetyltransferase [uncultured Methylibium sp.]